MKTLRRVGALVGIIAVLAMHPFATADPTDDDSPAPVATDAPAPPPPPPPGSTTFSLNDLGSSDTVWFDARRDITASTFSFIVPKGLTAASLNATVEIPVNLEFGYITAAQDGRTISRMPLPLKDQSALVIPLSDVRVTDNWASLTLTITAVPVGDTYCWDPMAPLRLVNTSVTFTGNEVPPTTVAAFLPPTPRKLTIAIPPKPTHSESEAAIQLAAALATRYGWMSTIINVVPLAGDSLTLPEAQPGERQMVLKETEDKGLTLQSANRITPQLLITGPGNELTNQTRLLTDQSLTYALSTKAVAGPLVTEQRPVGDTTTLGKMKQSGLSSELARPEVSIKIDQSQFAQPVGGIRVHLLGSHTPLAHNFNGEVIVSIGDMLLDRWPTNADGTIDHWVTIPDENLQRTTMLKVRMHTTGDPGHCNDYLNPMLRIDPDTEIQAIRSSPPAPPGFRSLPQALMPRVQIGIGDDAMGDTMRAAQIIVGLQRNSAIPLLVTLTSLKEAIDSQNPAVLISADGWTDQSLTLPFSAEQGRLTIGTLDAGGTFTELTLDPAIKWGSLQTLFDGRRSVLIATSNGAPAQLDELLRWLNDKSGRWGDLDGRAAISVPGNPGPLTVPNRRSDLPDSDAASSGQGFEKWIWRVAGAIAAIALAGALWILWRTYRSRGSVTEDLVADELVADDRLADAPVEGLADEDGPNPGSEPH